MPDRHTVERARRDERQGKGGEPPGARPQRPLALVNPEHPHRAARRLPALGRCARVIAALAGAWLVVSGAVWAGPRVNVIVVGALVIASALAGLWRDEARFSTSGLAVWLVFASLASDRPVGSPAWNDVAVAAAVFALSLVPRDDA